MEYYIIKDCRRNWVPVTKSRYYYIKNHGGTGDKKITIEDREIRIMYQDKSAPQQLALDF